MLLRPMGNAIYEGSFASLRMTIGWEIKKARIASRLQSSLRDLLISCLYPALKRWATGERSSGAKIRARVAMLVVHSIHKRAQFARTGGMTQLTQRLGFDLANTLARDCE